MSHIKSLKLIDWCFITFVVLKLVWDLLVLAPVMVPWYDEIVFASITDSLVHGNGFTESCYGFGWKSAYGPVYFWLTALSTSVFGFNPFGFRIVAMAAFYGCALLFLYILSMCRIPKSMAYVGTALFLTEPTITGSAVNSRMELVAIFFVLLGYVFYIRGRKTQSMPHVIWVSLSFSLAALTTPRSIVVMLPLSLYIVWEFLRRKQWFLLAVFVSIPLIAGVSWILYEHGSFYQCWLYYFGKKDFDANGNFVSFFLGGNCQFGIRQLPLLLLGVLSVTASVLKKKWDNFIFLAPFLAYTVIIAENGSYRAYGGIFLVLTVFCGYPTVCLLKPFWHKMVLLGIGGSIAINLLMFGVSIVRFFQGQPAIHAERVYAWVQASIEPHSVVLSDDAYFYALRKNDCTFRRISHEWYKPETYYKKLETTSKPEYILVSHDGGSRVADLYTTELIGEYHHDAPEPSDWMQYLFQKKIMKRMRDYSGKLYRVIRQEDSGAGESVTQTNVKNATAMNAALPLSEKELVGGGASIVAAD